MSRYNPRPSRQLRDEVHPSEIAGHRPMMAPRIVSEESVGEDDPLHTLRGQPDELYEDESYHRGMNVDKFNHALRSGHGFRNEDEAEE